MNTPTVLKRILQRKQEEVSLRKQSVSLSTLQARIIDLPEVRGFASAIELQLSKKKAAIIAEIKKASPSKGVIREDFQPAEHAADYQQYGATCLSVLTDKDFFQGDEVYLKQAREACKIPVLRKDFIIDAYQVIESRYVGADCILLIAAALSRQQLVDFSHEAIELGLDVLVEVHNEAELEMALDLPTPLLGINNRDLHTFDVSLDTTLRLLPAIPESKIVVTESGILTSADVEKMTANNVWTFLVGEAFMRQQNPGKELAALFDGYL
ncbi:indole-3-glycerol phosphate synthase TrpC [Zooshikella ganghwensis]|uniref:indole-3-glycerol phosphate synthase TrpC n=1 Tax=Zooshikella ganghwensis TaxID=202772 RepID=UPI0004050788|nr:indole-3-glycerol phosphate synthase TrpC [Zooshikella ganghwensis]